MKTRSLYVTGLMFLITATSTAVLAADYNKGLKQELDDVEQMYPKRQRGGGEIEITKIKAPEVQAAAQPNVIINQNQPMPQQAQAQQPVYILQQQPPTNVEANTVRETKADVLRKQREEVERQNEMKLIEKIEDERLNAEKDRAEKIFNPQQPKVEATPAPVVVVQPTPAPIQQPVPVVVAPQPEVVSAVQTIKVEEAVKEEKKDERSRFSIGALAGIGSYASVNNVSGAYALGGIVEIEMANRIAVEGTVAYSTYDIKNIYAYSYSSALVTTLNQWNIDAAVKYKFLRGTVTPVAGAVLGFTRRDYSDRINYGYYTNSTTGSNAFDGGFLAGLDVRASDNLTIGADVRYLMNISYRTDNPLAYGYGNSYNIGTTPLESLSYSIISLNTKLSF